MIPQTEIIARLCEIVELQAKIIREQSDLLARADLDFGGEKLSAEKQAVARMYDEVM